MLHALQVLCMHSPTDCVRASNKKVKATSMILAYTETLAPKKVMSPG